MKIITLRFRETHAIESFISGAVRARRMLFFFCSLSLSQRRSACNHSSDKHTATNTTRPTRLQLFMHIAMRVRPPFR